MIVLITKIKTKVSELEKFNEEIMKSMIKYSEGPLESNNKTNKKISWEQDQKDIKKCENVRFDDQTSK